MKFSIFMMPLHHPTENPSLAFDRDISLIEYADELGYDEFFIGEHHSGGWETMVTPLAQFVGSQAAVNVITGERYKEVTDQSIQYALGHWGKEAPAVMDPNIKDRILNRPRANDWRKWSPPDLSLKEVRQKFGGPGVSDEELVLRIIAGEDAVKAMLAAGAPREYVSARQPLVKLIGELAKRKDCSQVYIQKGEFSLRLEKKQAGSYVQ